MNKINKIWEDCTGSAWPRPGKFTAGEYDTHLEAFAITVVSTFIGEVYQFQDDTGSNSQDEAFGNAKEKLFGIEE